MQWSRDQAVRTFKAADIDCDATAILLKNGKFVDKTDVVYFGNLVHKSALSVIWE